MGPGLITGASDDDPSGIGTYSQVGAQFGFGLLWTMVLSYPLMTAIQEISARIGRVTGVGISGNLRKSYPKPLLYSVLFVVSAANIFNLGADIGAMGAATQLVLPGKASLFIVMFGIGSLAGILLVRIRPMRSISSGSRFLSSHMSVSSFLSMSLGGPCSAQRSCRTLNSRKTISLPSWLC